MPRTGLMVACAVGLSVAYLLLWPAPIDPLPLVPAANPGRVGPFAPNRELKSAQKIVEGVGEGPEDVTLGPDGFFYTGLQDGRIVRFRDDGSKPETFVNTGGRPLGMQFDKGGNLIVADAFQGLLSIAADRSIKLLTNSVQGERLLFPDDLDIASDGTVWFSNASQRFDQHRWILEFLETRPTGTLLSYDPNTGTTTVRLNGLMFANGVALGPDENFVLVNETIGARITRLWLRGPKAGMHETFIELPGYPDNLSYNKHGIFWVALPAPRNGALEGTWGSPFVRKVVAKLPQRLLRAGAGGLDWVIGIDPAGKVIRNLQEPGGHGINSVNQFDAKLYFGGIATTFVGRYSLR